jgi:hypothetical protein
VVGDVAFMQRDGAPGVPKGWAAAQAATSADFSHGSFFWTHISGGLNYQVSRDSCSVVAPAAWESSCSIAMIYSARCHICVLLMGPLVHPAGRTPSVPVDLPYALPGHCANRTADLQGVQCAIRRVPHGAARPDCTYWHTEASELCVPFTACAAASIGWCLHTVLFMLLQFLSAIGAHFKHLRAMGLESLLTVPSLASIG